MKSGRHTRLVAPLVGLATRRPLLVVVACIVLAGLAALALPRLQLRGGIYELFPRQDGPIGDLETFARAFGSTDELVALVEGDRQRPEQVRDTTAWLRRQLDRSPLIERVVGADPAASMQQVAPYVFSLLGDGDWPAAQRKLTGELEAQVAQLRRVLLAPLAPDTKLVAVDPLGLLRPVASRWRRDSAAGQGHPGVALVVARPTKPASEIAFCEQLDRFLSGLIARRPHREVTIKLTGPYRYALFFSRLLRRDLLVSSGAALLVAALLFLAFFRSLRLLPLAVITGGLAVVLTLAIAAFTVGSLNALSLAFAAICIGLGIDAVIHVVSRCRQIAPAVIDQGERLRQGIGALAPALLAATATTLVAFGSFALSRFGGIADTGLLAAVSLAISLLLTLLLFPALAVLTGAFRRTPRSGQWLDRLLAGLATLTLRRPLAILGVAGLVLAAALTVGLPRLHVEGNLRAAVPADLPPVLTDRAISSAFTQSERLVVLVRAGDLERALQQNEKVAWVADQLRRQRKISGFETLAHLLPSRKTQQRRLARLSALGPARIAERMRAALLASGLRPKAFSPFLDALQRAQVLRPDKLPSQIASLVARRLAREGSGALVATIIHPRSAAHLPAISAAIAALSRPDAPVSLTGAALAGPAVAEVLRGDLLLMSGVTFGAVLVILVGLLRRAWPVVATCLSLSASGLLFCALLPLCGLRLDLYTIMIIPLLIGYGVDDHIYIVRHWIDEGGRAALAHSGRAVLATTLTSGGALGALMLCQVDGLRALGQAAVLGLGLGLLGSVVVLPALLSLSRCSLAGPKPRVD